jgi:hypothetical protein
MPDTDPTYEGMVKTEKGPAYYPGETVHGAAGSSGDKGHPGSGSVNLSPPNARSMGGAMTGSGLPPANGINLGIAEPRGNPLPPGPAVDPMMSDDHGRGLPPGPECGGHNVGNPGQLPPGADVGSKPAKGPRGPKGSAGGGGQLPPGVGV